MKRNLLIIGTLIVGILLLSPLSAFAAGEAEGKANAEIIKEKKGIVPQSPSSDEQQDKPSPKRLESQSQKSVTPVNMPVYQPPLRGAPGGRVGGGTRGIGDELITLFVLAPNHVGLTLQEQPILYWYLSNPTKHPIEVTIIIEEATHPLVEKRLPLPPQLGIHALRLKDFDIRLSTGKQYRWFLAIVSDPNRRSRDIISGGIIERIDVPEGLRMKLSQIDKQDIPSVYAESGIWYDTIMTISQLIEANPNEMVLRKQRAALLEQVGLSEVAQYEMKQSTQGR